MPWGAFHNIEDGELRALYRFLEALAPVSAPAGDVTSAR